MLKDSLWIVPQSNFEGICPEYLKSITVKKGLQSASLTLTCLGVYEAKINDARVSEYVLAPGCTDFITRLQYQTYDVTHLLKAGENTLSVLVGNGWFRGGITRSYQSQIQSQPSLIAELILEYETETERIGTDLSWQVKKSKVLFSDIYDGEIFDANFESEPEAVQHACYNKAILIPQEGEEIKEQERFKPIATFVTPKGERVLDFGQEITGYIGLETNAKNGEEISLSFAEVLDKDGNFYTENYRDAKCIYKYICKDGKQSYKPKTVFYGFRYVRVDSAPEQTKFTAIVVHSELKRTGYIATSHEKVNQLFSNILWGQKGNFLDIPTDCPQRNERLGWTGDAQVFIKTASYQYDVKKFFTKWLNDMQAEQRNDGAVPDTVPNFVVQNKINADFLSPAWGDAAVICPWVLYEMYGDKDLLQKHFPMMEKWISYMESTSREQNLWVGHSGHGDWLGLDNEEGSYKGATDEDLIASAYLKYCADLVAKSAKVLQNGKYDFYAQKAENVRKAFIKRFPVFKTQTECVLALHFDLTDHKKQIADQLAEMIKQNGNRLTTGFVGTPYLLFALSENGYTELAYTLLLQEKFPSWLFSVNQGATTIWEHWDSKKEDGTFWSKDMNSFNHYAYGSVLEWVYAVSAGIRVSEKGIEIAPKPDKQLGDLNAEFHSMYGLIKSAWQYEGERVHYEIEIPIDCYVTIDGKTEWKKAGKYRF
ncbi:MAG: family 78 glycoside hydrolase catalytic domain [Clostridia bacterium]|nr:family 78 glycoside hydrolase catalytic domain [Clostridia bacterium]